MMTVRFPSGVSIQYNNATHVERKPGIARLYNRKQEPRTWIASIQGDCIIEGERACRVYDATAGDRAEQVLQNLEGLPHDTLRQLKRRLGKYQSRRREWRQ